MRINKINLNYFRGVNISQNNNKPTKPTNETVKVQHKTDGTFFVLTENGTDKEFNTPVTRIFSMSIPYELYPKECFEGAVINTKFCIIEIRENDEEIARILVGADGVIPLYCERKGCCQNSIFTRKDFEKLEHLVEAIRTLSAASYFHIDMASESLSILEKHFSFKEDDEA